MKTKVSKKQIRGPGLAIPGEIAAPLAEFATAHGMTRADVVRAALRRFLPQLASGEMLIVNGKLVSREELTAA